MIILTSAVRFNSLCAGWGLLSWGIYIRLEGGHVLYRFPLNQITMTIKGVRGYTTTSNSIRRHLCS
jgi:hypothetical protein